MYRCTALATLPTIRARRRQPMCADEQEKFWPFHDALFDWQGEFGNQAFTNNRINAGVAAFGLNQGAYSACISSRQARHGLGGCQPVAGFAAEFFRDADFHD